MRSGDEPNPWIGVAVRFFFGACFGAMVGLGWLAISRTTVLPVWAWIASPALLCGLLAAYFGDTFWENLTALSWWWWR